jgi:hypothetical protein
MHLVAIILLLYAKHVVIDRVMGLVKETKMKLIAMLMVVAALLGLITASVSVLPMTKIQHFFTRLIHGMLSLELFC